MKLSKMSQEELELCSYTDLARMILEEEGKPLNTPTIFKKICELLGLSETDYTNKIGDFYTSLTTDKDFVLLDDGNWDLRDHHPVSVVLEDDEEVDEEEDLEDTLEAEEEMEEMASEDELDLDDDDTADLGDIEDAPDDELTILTEEELDR